MLKVVRLLGVGAQALLLERNKDTKSARCMNENGTSSQKHFIGILSRPFVYIPLIYIRLSAAQFFSGGVRLRRHCSALTDDLQPLT